MIDINIYKVLGDELSVVAEEWDVDSHAIDDAEVLGGIVHHHRVALSAFNLAVLRNDELPLQWLEPSGGAAKNGVSIFATMAYIKSGAAGLNGMDKNNFGRYITSGDGINYLLQVADGPGLVSERTRTDFGISTTPNSIQVDHELRAGAISINDGKLTIPRFDGVHMMHTERAEEKGLDMSKKCIAMQRGAFKPIFNAINLLSLNSGAAEATYDKFAAMKQAEHAAED